MRPLNKADKDSLLQQFLAGGAHRVPCLELPEQPDAEAGQMHQTSKGKGSIMTDSHTSSIVELRDIRAVQLVTNGNKLSIHYDLFNCLKSRHNVSTASPIELPRWPAPVGMLCTDDIAAAAVLPRRYRTLFKILKPNSF
jgi:hypothetical protein